MDYPITDRLRCNYNGRDFSGPAPEGMVLPTGIMLEAAAEIERLMGEVTRLTSALSSSRSDERERIITLLDGIDRTETDEPSGWWETSAGAEFGAKKLAAIRSLSSTDQGEGERG